MTGRCIPVLVAVAIALPPGAGAAAAKPQASRRAQSLAAFDQMASVMTSPRCMNCHTVTSFPRQGDDRHPHLFGVSRGPSGMGPVGLSCSTCHGRANNSASGVPGADDDWRLAPLGMGWERRSRADICRRLKDPKLNGHRTGAGVIDHLHTHLVAWAWDPGADLRGRPRTRPPLSYETFLGAAQAWVASGEACP